MFTKDNVLYADAFKYLRHKTKPIIAMTVPLAGDNTEEDFEEIPMNDPLDVTVIGKRVYWNGRKFLNIPKNMTYGGIKASVVKSRYSDDDQMALILNREKSERGEELYQKMQQWRDFAKYIAENIINK